MYFIAINRVMSCIFIIPNSTFHKIETRSSIKVLKHASLHMYLKNTFLKFDNLLTEISMFKYFTENLVKRLFLYSTLSVSSERS